MKAPQFTKPQLMRMAVLTAAVQYPTDAPREAFKSFPLEASRNALNNWIDGAAAIGADGIQISAALQEVDSYNPPEQMLDPVASHLPIRTLRDGSGEDLSDKDAEGINALCKLKGLTITDLGIFENLLKDDPTIRNQVHQHILRGGRAAMKLKPSGCKGVATFIGRDVAQNMSKNIYLFEQFVIAILKEYDKMGLVLRIENCPMPGWSPADEFIQNIAATPRVWITLARIARKHGVEHVLRFTYDESHSILTHSRARWAFAILRAAGFGHLIDSGHAKDQNHMIANIAADNCFGKRIGLGIHTPQGDVVTDPAALGGAWGRMNSFHTLPGFSLYNSYAQHAGRQADWVEHQYGLRELGVDPAATFIILEHEQNKKGHNLRDQDFERVLEAIQLSMQFMRGADAMADAQFRIAKWCPAVSEGAASIYQAHDPLSVIPGIQEVVDDILAFQI